MLYLIYEKVNNGFSSRFFLFSCSNKPKDELFEQCESSSYQFESFKHEATGLEYQIPKWWNEQYINDSLLEPGETMIQYSKEYHDYLNSIEITIKTDEMAKLAKFSTKPMITSEKDSSYGAYATLTLGIKIDTIAVILSLNTSIGFDEVVDLSSFCQLAPVYSSIMDNVPTQP